MGSFKSNKSRNVKGRTKKHVNPNKIIVEAFHTPAGSPLMRRSYRFELPSMFQSEYVEFEYGDHPQDKYCEENAEFVKLNDEKRGECVWLDNNECGLIRVDQGSDETLNNEPSVANNKVIKLFKLFEGRID